MKLGDIPSVLDLAYLMYTESDYVDMEFDDEGVYRVLRAAVGDHKYSEGFVLRDKEADHRVVGAVVVYQTALPFVFGTVVSDFGFYVLPVYRGTAGAGLLLRQVETWARNQHADRIQLGVTANIANDRAHAFYEQTGYTHVGHNYRKILNVRKP